MIEHISNGYKTFTQLKGRTNRAEYWTVGLFHTATVFLWLFIFGESTGEAFLSLFILVATVVNIGLGIRRMHDVNKSGWFLIVPIVNFVYALSASVDEGNRWGEQSEKKDEDAKKTTSSSQREKITVVDEDSEIEALEKRLSELKLQKEQQSLSELEDEKKKKEILKEIETLKKELGE